MTNILGKRRQLRRGALIAPVLASAALVVGACGASPSGLGVAHIGTTTSTVAQAPGGASGTGSPSSDKRAIALAYSRCMRSHGVPNFPDPSAGGGISIQGGPGSGLDPRSPAFKSAQSTCIHLLPNGGQATPAQQAQALAQALKFSQCMRAHGLKDFPDPQSSGGGIGIRITVKAGQGTDLNPQSPQFQAAQKACKDLLPFKGSNGQGAG